MIVEQRRYTLRPGATPEFVALVRDEGLAIQTPHLGAPLGYFISKSGILNQIVHLWGFDSLGDREQKRRSLAADPAWKAFAPKVLPLIERMESQILIPTDFSAIGGHAG
jgi:hypothetical protein